MRRDVDIKFNDKHKTVAFESNKFHSNANSIEGKIIDFYEGVVGVNQSAIMHLTVLSK